MSNRPRPVTFVPDSAYHASGPAPEPLFAVDGIGTILEAIPGYDEGEGQVLFHDSGTFKWVTLTLPDDPGSGPA